ncbi:hypothetical protein ACHAPJ_010995 [Fusarium lateritium]
MATLNTLKRALRQQVDSTTSLTKALSDAQYSDGFDLLVHDAGWKAYQDFVIPQLSLLLAPLFNSRNQMSVLEIGPGPKSVLGHLPSPLKRKIGKYTAFEPNLLSAAKLEEWLNATPEAGSSLPCLKSTVLHRKPFSLNSGTAATENTDEKFHVILFCHSMYGMNPKQPYIEQALGLLVQQPEDGFVVVFHRDDSLHLDGLVCHRSASFPGGVTRIEDEDEVLDRFAPLIAGFVMSRANEHKAVQAEWRRVCRALDCHDGAYPGHLGFSSPDIMLTFTRHATKQPELVAQVPLVNDRKIKNREARLHRPAAVVKPTTILQVQQCVQWALKHGVGLTIIGGGHSGHCRWPNVVSVDMCDFDQVHIVDVPDGDRNSVGLVVAEAGCRTGDIIQKTKSMGLTVPLGARPSVGTGLWLQGGIGHLARMYGLGCDAIVGAVMVGVESGQVLCVGCVPDQCQPPDAIRPKDETDLLWALQGAGTNFGIVISVTFQAYPAQIFTVRDWSVPLNDEDHARLMLKDFDICIASKLPRDSSADAYLYGDAGQLYLGVPLLQCSTTDLNPEELPSAPSAVETILGPEKSRKIVDGVGLFDTEMYISGMHGGHGGGKTSSFKRCVFLKDIGKNTIIGILMAAIHNRPSHLCYFHLLQGGGAVGDMAEDATAFGCGEWDFACVVTGVWPRDQDGTQLAHDIVTWVYKIVGDLLPMSLGVYSADLGPDPRDAVLATKAFGLNHRRLASLKRRLDPHNVLAYACPLLTPRLQPKLIVLVTGQHGAGKDYCAEVWDSVFSMHDYKSLVVSISDATKREYAAATGADLNRLLGDRAYKEQHRKALTAFFQEQLQRRPRLVEEHFLEVVHSAIDVDVLLITEMRDEAPVATLSHLVPDSRLIDVRVEASEALRISRRKGQSEDNNGSCMNGNNAMPRPTALDYRPSFTFDNDAAGDEAARAFAKCHLIPFLSEELQRLASMVRSAPDFPRPGIEFRHVLNICHQQGGLTLCASLLHSIFSGDWEMIDAVICCEAGGFIFASRLEGMVEVPIVPVRAAGKLPPPTISVPKCTSHISSHFGKVSENEIFEMDATAIHKGASVVVVDDVLATGRTLLAVLKLLAKAGIRMEDTGVMVVAEFPVHRGREFLRQYGYGRVHIQSCWYLAGSRKREEGY